MGQAYYSPISINSGQVPSTQTDFPVLVSQTDNRFKTIGNGGHVNNSSGFDIRPYSDTGLSSALTYELERYNASTGEVIMWVKVASLSASTTPIYLGYGDTSLTTDGSSTSTFSNSFSSVYHLKDGTTLSLADSSGNSRTLTNHATATAATGQIDGGVGLASSSSQYLDNGSTTVVTQFTFSAWIKGTSFPNAYNTVIDMHNAGVYKDIYVKSNGKIAMFLLASGDVSFDGTGTTTLSTGTWYHLALAYDSTNGLKGYINGALEKSVAANGNAGTNSTFSIGNDQVNAGRFWNGTLDEVRASSVARSANWITTEYNNQVAPGTFETLGTEVSLSTNTGNFFLLFP